MDVASKEYMNPITLEAELFVHNLEILSKTHHKMDAILLSALTKVMDAIDTFLESNPTEAVFAKNTKLMECKNITHIKRIFHCTQCKTDLGKSIEKVTLHLIEKCITSANRDGTKAPDEYKTRRTTDKNSTKNLEHKVSAKNKRQETEAKLTKKARSLLITNLNTFFEDHIKIATKLKFIPDYNEIENDLLNAIKPSFPNDKIKIYKFGSRLAGIGSRESDLDLYVDIGDTFHVIENRPNEKTILKLQLVASALLKGNKWKGLVKIEKARVPILKVVHASTGLECDINFSNSLGTVNTTFFEYIFNIQPLSRLLCIFVKKWLNRTRLSSEVSTYSFMLMVLFYLQTRKILPSMAKLQEYVIREKNATVGPWLYMYATPTLNELNIPMELLNQQNILKYIRGFFNFYTNINFESNIICPYLGKIVTKSDFPDLMPSRYISYVEEYPDFDLQVDKPLVVQDPFQLNHNTTKSLSTIAVKNIKTLMIKSLQVLNDAFPFLKNKN